MRILVISATFPYQKCGVGDYTFYLSKAFAKKGHDVKILTSQDIQCDEKTSVKISSSVTSWSIWNLFGIIREIKKNIPKFISIQYESGAYQEKTAINWLPLFCRFIFPGVPVFTTFHAYHGPASFSKLNLLILSIFSHRLLITNEVDYRKISRKARLFLSKVINIPIGTNLDYVSLPKNQHDVLKQKWEINPQEFVICFFGFILPDKGLDKVIEAIKVLKQKGKQIKLLIIGGNSLINNNISVEHEAYLKSRIDELDLSENVIWTGYLERKEVSSLLQISDLGAFIYQDGMSLRRGSLVAAITHLLPVITTYNDPLPEFVKNDENIILTSYENIPELAARIELYIDNPDRLKQIRKKLKSIAPKFSWEVIADSYIEEYLKVGKIHEPFQ